MYVNVKNQMIIFAYEMISEFVHVHDYEHEVWKITITIIE